MFLGDANETANLLNSATDRSLVILDEIGRGTSTYDGLSIAWVVSSTSSTTPPGRPRTLFATHDQEPACANGLHASRSPLVVP